MKKIILINTLILLNLININLEAKTIHMKIGKEEKQIKKLNIIREDIIKENHYIQKNKYVFELNVAGIKMSDITMGIKDNTLILIMERKKPNNIIMKKNEIKYGIIKKEIPLPRNIKKETLNLELNNGILKIQIQKK